MSGFIINQITKEGYSIENLTTQIDRNGNQYEYSHNYGGMLLEQRLYTNRNINADDPDVFVSTNTYNQDGLVLSSTQPEGNSKSYLYDDLGNTYIAQKATLGSKTTSSQAKTNLIAGIPTLATFKFTNISPNASSISLFQPQFWTDARFRGDFRNINF